MGDEKKDEIEQGTIDAYMDNEVAEAIQNEDRIAYLKGRLEAVKHDYKALRLHQCEAEAKKDEQTISKLTAGFRENYKARKYVVTQLRALGQTVEDPFIK